MGDAATAGVAASTAADREGGGIAGGDGSEKGQRKMGQVKYNLTFVTFGILEFVWWA